MVHESPAGSGAGAGGSKKHSRLRRRLEITDTLSPGDGGSVSMGTRQGLRAPPPTAGTGADVRSPGGRVRGGRGRGSQGVRGRGGRMTARGRIFDYSSKDK